MSKELNKAPVEQAGGDERAAFRPAQVISYRPGMGEVTIYVAGRVPGYMNIGDTVYVSDRAPVEQPSAALAQPSPVLPPFAEKVLAKLRRFYDCASDFESGGVDIGRHWLDLLTQLGLLNRVQRSPALWEITQQGEDLLGTQQPSPAQAEHANSGYDQCRDDVARALGLRPSQERGFAWSYLLASIKSCVMASEDTAQAQHSGPEEFSFEYRHPNGESHTVTVSRDQVINEMPDFLFEALCSKFCNCEPAGETNVVECCCDEYAEEFKLLAAAPAQAQHSVPEGWMLVPVEPLLNMMSDKDHDTRITAERQLLSILAAAPGKEVGHE